MFMIVMLHATYTNIVVFLGGGDSALLVGMLVKVFGYIVLKTYNEHRRLVRCPLCGKPCATCGKIDGAYFDGHHR